MDSHVYLTKYGNRLRFPSNCLRCSGTGSSICDLDIFDDVSDTVSVFLHLVDSSDLTLCGESLLLDITCWCTVELMSSVIAAGRTVG